MTTEFTFKQRLGCWLHERWRTEWVLRFPRLARLVGMSWTDLCNRGERLLRDPVTGARRLDAAFSSTLTVARIFPTTGGRLLQHCLREWPIVLDPPPRTIETSTPAVSIIVGVRGTGRLPQFRACIDSLLGQVDAAVEIIVVEQSFVPQFEHLIPAGASYLHQQATDASMPYNRSWALNGGAQVARGRILLLHDADMLLPARAACEIVRLMELGLDALRLPRLLFYLDEATSLMVQADAQFPALLGFERVVANNRTPIVVSREAYAAIGGHDEAFFGWGSEDDEFMDRLRSLRVGEGAPFPIVHLWHESAASPVARDRNAELLRQRRLQPLAMRVSQLRERAFGGSRPAVEWPASPPIASDAQPSRLTANS